jgi:AcrR family transcriptional regulator
MDAQALAAATFPRRPELSREFIALHRRRRFAVAAAEVAHESGLGGISVATLVALAGTARNTFYAVFENTNDCLCFALADAYERLFESVRVEPGEGPWLTELETAISGLYQAVAEDSLAAELFLLHSFGVSQPPRNVSFETGAAALEHLLARGRAAASGRGREPLPATAEEYWSRVVLSVATRSLRRDEVAALPGLAGEVTLLIGTEYLGAEMATVAAEG